MKSYKSILLGMLVATLVGCTGWLTEPSPGVTKLEDFFSVGETALQSVNAAYAPLMWEYNTTYFNEWFIGDVMSDDALKGGQNIGDMADVYGNLLSRSLGANIAKSVVESKQKFDVSSETKRRMGELAENVRKEFDSFLFGSGFRLILNELHRVGEELTVMV